MQVRPDHTFANLLASRPDPAPPVRPTLTARVPRRGRKERSSYTGRREARAAQHRSRARVQSRRSTLDETAERVAIASAKAQSDVAQRLTKRKYSFACVSVDVVGRRHTGVQR